MPGKADEKVAACIKEKGNWGKLDPEHRFDHKDFNADVVRDHITVASPKLVSLLENIHSLDEADKKKYGHTFKHFIYSDIKSAYGAKLIASALSSAGFDHAYGLKKTSRGMSFTIDKDLLQSKTSRTFATLTSVAFFEKPIGVNFRKEVLAEFNKRPDNIYGERIRIIILDSGFREGVDLFDVKYVHLMEPIATKSDEKQAIGRGTRYCGQKGLQFDAQKGWPLYVYRYETVLSPSIQQYLVSSNKDLAPADSFFQLFMKFSNIDPKKLTFANELETVAIGSAVDKDLTREIHEFKVPDFQTGGGPYDKLREQIKEKYGNLAWSKIEVKNMCVPSGGATILPFTPTQDFVRNYFTPKYSHPGMLLWHSVGTGKTCTAIATASSTFEKEDYTILYVTRYTLKGDVWKNMFDQACSVIIQDLLKKGATLPEAHAARLRLLSKGWFEPMSYRQFSNLLAGKNQLSKVLVERNGTKDILHKTLIIIDEAHKLFAADVEGQEKADMDVVREALLHSSRVSGKDGAKLLLMTATPYTSDPMDLIRLLNLCRPASEQLPETFEEFAKVYLDESGTFTQETKERFYNDIAGYISYLNREKDIRSFSYPVVKNIQVPMSDYSFLESIRSLRSVELMYTRAMTDLSNNKSLIEQDAAKMIKHMENELKETLKPSYEEHQRCLVEVKKGKDQVIAETNANHRKRLQQCEQLVKAMKESLKEQYKKIIQQVREEGKKEAKQKGLSKEEKLAIREKVQHKITLYRQDLDFDLDQVTKDQTIENCRVLANESYALELAEVMKKTFSKENCDMMLTEIKKMEDKIRKQNNEKVEFFRERKKKDLEIDKERLEDLRKKYHEIQGDTHTQINIDKSQRSGLEKCLQGKVKPAYPLFLRGDSMVEMDEEDEVEEMVEEEGKKKNVFVIVGHGSENVVEFNRRTKVPEDKVVVVFPVCARPNFMDTGCQFLDMFNDPKYEKLLKNPIKYRDQISNVLKRPIRVYLPGEYIPDMSTNLFLDFEKDTTVIAKSGVYRMQKIPAVDRTNFEKAKTVKEQLGSPLCDQFTGVIKQPADYTSKIHHEVYRGNLYKPASKRESYKTLSYRNFRIMDIMKEVGAGIYYYIGCRSSMTEVDPEKYVRVLEASEAQQGVRHRTEKIQPVLPLIYEIGEDEKEEEYRESPRPKSSPKKEESKEKEDDQKQKKEKAPGNTKQELLRLRELTPMIYLQKENLLFDHLDEWKAELEAMVQTPKVKALLQEIEVIPEIHKQREKAKEELMVKELKVDGKSYFQFFFVSILTINKKKHRFHPKLYGMLLSTMTDKTIKCSASLLKKRIVSLYGKKRFIDDLPITIEEANDPQLFKRLCQKIKSL